MAAKFPNINDIAWGKIREVRVSPGPGRDSYSFEFPLHGRKQKMTISIESGSTAYTLSAEDGTPLVHGVQKGREFKVLDFSAKPELRGPGGKIRRMGKIRRK